MQVVKKKLQLKCPRDGEELAIITDYGQHNLKGDLTWVAVNHYLMKCNNAHLWNVTEDPQDNTITLKEVNSFNPCKTKESDQDGKVF